MVSTHEKLCQRCFKGGDVTVSTHEPDNSIIYLISDSYQLFILRCFFSIPVSFVCNIPPLHILRCASSRTSFKGGDVMVSIHEQHNSIIYVILDSLCFDVFSLIVRLSFANPSLILRLSFAYRSLFLYRSRGKCKKKIFLLIGKFAN